MKHPNVFRAVLVCTGIVLSSLGVSAHAQHASTMPGGPMDQGHATEAAASPSTEAFRMGSAKMMKDMSGPYTGNADKDFVSHMIPHHQGAVSMAQVELKYGKDPEMRKLAQEIIKAQTQEIAFMKKWQAKHGVH